jgi:hypothetical protein
MITTCVGYPANLRLDKKQLLLFYFEWLFFVSSILSIGIANEKFGNLPKINF